MSKRIAAISAALSPVVATDHWNLHNHIIRRYACANSLNILACILTDAPLNYGTPLTTDVCGDCMECIKACKYGAFGKEGKSFRWIGEKCRCYDLIMNPVTLKWTYVPCNSVCVNVCPIGK